MIFSCTQKVLSKLKHHQWDDVHKVETDYYNWYIDVINLEKINYFLFKNSPEKADQIFTINIVVMKAIRKLNFGWIIILIGIVAILSGVSMTEGQAGGKTLLCLDDACVYIQGVSNIVVGCFTIGLGIYLLVKK